MYSTRFITVSTRRPFASGSPGFTLIELLVAVAIGSVIISALYATFFSVLGVGSVADERLDSKLSVGRFLDRFSRDIEGAYFNPAREYTGLYGAITGPGSEIRLTTFTYPVITDRGPVSDLVTVRYHLKESGNGYTLYRESSNPYIAEKYDIELIESVETMKIKYLSNGIWTGVWDSATYKGLPDGVRVEVLLQGGQRQSGVYRSRID